ncbi:MAG: tetratricopeptide repeat protein [Terriglobales bacterium]
MLFLGAAPPTLAADSTLSRGQSLLQSKHYGQAVTFYDAYLQKHPATASAFEGRAQAYFGLKRPAEAGRDISQAIEIAPTGSAYRLRGTLEELGGNTRLALNDYRNATRINPNDVEAFREYAMLCHELNRFVEAVDAWTKAIELEPKNAYFYERRGREYQKMDEDDKAYADAKKATILNPKDSWGFNLMGMIDDAHQRYPQAIDNGMRALALYPNFHEAIQVVGHSYVRQKQYDQAIKFLTPYCAKTKKARVFDLRAQAYLGLKEPQKALQDYNSALADDPTEPNWYLARARIFEQLGKKAEAQKEYTKAHEAAHSF